MTKRNKRINFKAMSLEERRAYNREHMKAYLARIKSNPALNERFIEKRKLAQAKYYNSTKGKQHG